MAAYLLLLSLALCPLSAALPWLEDQVDWNLNTNQETTDPNKYSGSWDNHVYHESPANWRFPFYTVTLDRFVNGDPTNDDANATAWEHDIYSNQFRFGGDIKGLANSLDYIQGMGIKVVGPEGFSEVMRIDLGMNLLIFCRASTSQEPP